MPAALSVDACFVRVIYSDCRVYLLGK